MIRKQINSKAQILKATNGLVKANVAGLLISDINGEIVVSLFGEKKRALPSIHQALDKTDWLRSIAQYVIEGAKVTLSKDGQILGDGVNYESAERYGAEDIIIEPEKTEI